MITILSQEQASKDLPDIGECLVLDEELRRHELPPEFVARHHGLFELVPLEEFSGNHTMYVELNSVFGDCKEYDEHIEEHLYEKAFSLIDWIRPNITSKWTFSWFTVNKIQDGLFCDIKLAMLFSFDSQKDAMLAKLTWQDFRRVPSEYNRRLLGETIADPDR